MSKSHIVYLQHILEECNFVTSVVTENLPMYQFLSDETLKRAISHNFHHFEDVPLSRMLTMENKVKQMPPKPAKTLAGTK